MLVMSASTLRCISAETAVAMATGAAERFSADYTLSVTGFAGPDGGSRAIPVGTIYIGYCSPVGVWSRKVVFQGDRLSIKRRATTAALDWIDSDSSTSGQMIKA